MPHVNLLNQSQQLNYLTALKENAYCIPIRLAVKRAMRVDSEEPLMVALPAHEDTAGIVRIETKQVVQWIIKKE
jgi:hypothetical protein